MGYIYNLFLQFGIKSRTLILFLKGGVYLSGRDQIYEDVIAEIIERPFFGIGLKGDTRIIGSSYVHNFFIEIIGNFGIVIGVIISVAIVMLIIKSLMNKERLNYNIAITWISLGFVHLMVSSSYLSDIKFWIMLGLLVNIAKYNKGTQEINLNKRNL